MMRLWQTTLYTGCGPVDCRLEFPTHAIGLAELAALAAQLSDQVQAAQRGGGGADLITCRAGCGACCRQLVCISPAEAFRLRDLMDQLAPDHRAAVQAQVERTRELAEAAGLGGVAAQVLDSRLDEAGHYALARGWFGMRQPCPFLGVDESCTIHAARPTACREYLVTSPAAWCDDPFARPPEPLPVAAPSSQALMNLCAQLLGINEGPIPLALALEWAAVHAESAEMKWPAELLLDRLIRHLEAVLAG